MKDRILGISSVVLAGANVLNWVCVGLGMAAFVLSYAFAPMALGHLAGKYPDQPVEPILDTIRVLFALGVLAGYPIHVVFSRLRAIVGSAQAGDPFIAANADRLKAVGWALLAIQMLDLVLGVVTIALSSRHVDTAGWLPSVGGWFSVLMVFVLARVFATGTQMRDDLEMTV